MVEMHLAAVRVELPSNTPILLLEENGEGNRTLPIYIGSAEAQAIAYALQGVVTPRPMTHDLMRDLLDELGATVEAIVITELRERTFYAEIRLRLGTRTLAVSARPSDAVALAVRTSAPIFAEDALIDAEGYVLHPEPADDDDENGGSDELVEQFRDFIEGLRPEDFGG
ncbi:MAG TPA: bifunctional nuclease family protein [Acidimicrobiales bacterium]|nr:bifunctional nuclease family protein [Acidimicrobiales bacterium]